MKSEGGQVGRGLQSVNLSSLIGDPPELGASVIVKSTATASRPRSTQRARHYPMGSGQSMWNVDKLYRTSMVSICALRITGNTVALYLRQQSPCGAVPDI